MFDGGICIGYPAGIDVTEDGVAVAYEGGGVCPWTDGGPDLLEAAEGGRFRGIFIGKACTEVGVDVEFPDVFERLGVSGGIVEEVGVSSERLGCEVARGGKYIPPVLSSLY